MFKNNASNNWINKKMNVLIKIIRKKIVMINNNYKKNKNNVWIKHNKTMKNQMKMNNNKKKNKKKNKLNKKKNKNKLMNKIVRLIKK